MVTIKEKPVGHAKRYTEDDKGFKTYHHRSYQITKEGSERGTRNKDLQNSQKKMNKMAVMSPYVLLVTLHVNKLNSPTKSHRMDKWIGKPRYNSMLLYKRLTLALSTQTEREGIEKRYFKQIVVRTKQG